jgi:hypothetical protein
MGIGNWELGMGDWGLGIKTQVIKDFKEKIKTKSP